MEGEWRVECSKWKEGDGLEWSKWKRRWGGMAQVEGDAEELLFNSFFHVYTSACSHLAPTLWDNHQPHIYN